MYFLQQAITYAGVNDILGRLPQLTGSLTRFRKILDIFGKYAPLTRIFNFLQ